MARGEIKALLFADGVSVTAATLSPQARYYKTDTTGWTGSVSTVTYSVASADDNGGTLDNSRLYAWTLKDVAQNYLQVLADIDFPTATTVRVTVGENLAVGTYVLVGV